VFAFSEISQCVSVCALFSPFGCLKPYILLLFLILKNCLTILSYQHLPDRSLPNFRVGIELLAVDDQSEISFSIR